ncbi:MAG: N-acetyltransferase [Oscillospiraceae bacterium]|nr:N-acetyltransferase [Oscillospiraceae bacterium]
MRIRMARPADVPAMLAVYRPFVEETAVTFEYETPSPAAFLARLEAVSARGPWLVLEDGGAAAGYAYLDRAFARAAYAWAADLSIYLAPRARGRGAGRALYTLLERMAARQGYRVLYGLVTSGNAASRRFHEALGYRIAALLPDCGYKLGRWHGVCWYEKRLGPAGDPGPMPAPAAEADWSGLDLSGLENFEIELQ